MGDGGLCGVGKGLELVQFVNLQDNPGVAVPYHGQPVLNPNSFLRKLPQSADAKSRLAFDAITMAADMGPDIEQKFRTAAEDHSLENGLNVDELLGSARRTFGIAAFFGSPPEESEACT